MKSSSFYEDLDVSYISNQKNRLQYIDGVANVLLDEVVVSKRKRKEFNSVYELFAERSMNYQFFDKRGISDYETALRYIAGIGVTPDYIYSMRNRNELVGIFVDGVPFEGYAGTSISSVGSLQSSTDDSFRALKELYPFQIVKQIDYIRGGAAMAFGGGIYKGGIISITIKDGSEKSSSQKDLTLKTCVPLGYQRPAEFYAPRYDTGNGGLGEGTDLRETIYWNPSIAIDSNKQAHFNFYTNDAGNTSYTITVEGVTQSGELIHATKKITKK